MRGREGRGGEGCRRWELLDATGGLCLPQKQSCRMSCRAAGHCLLSSLMPLRPRALCAPGVKLEREYSKPRRNMHPVLKRGNAQFRAVQRQRARAAQGEGGRQEAGQQGGEQQERRQRRQERQGGPEQRQQEAAGCSSG